MCSLLQGRQKRLLYSFWLNTGTQEYKKYKTRIHTGLLKSKYIPIEIVSIYVRPINNLKYTKMNH